MLTGDGAGGEHGSGEHQFPVNRNGLPLEWSDIQTHRIVDERELTLGAQHRGDLWDIGGALVQTGYMGDMWDAELGQLRRPGLAVIDAVMRATLQHPAPGLCTRSRADDGTACSRMRQLRQAGTESACRAAQPK